MASFLLKPYPMLPLAIISLFLWALNELSLLNYLANTSANIHESCLNYVGEHSKWAPIYRALTCGGSIYKEAFSSTLKNLGLIHLFVFSGAHLVFAERLLSLFNLSHRATGMSLSLLCMASGMKPPAFRALMGWLLKSLNISQELNWSPSLRLAMTGLLCLSLNPQWWQGLSLPLSWSAAICFCFFPKSQWKATAAIYFVSLPLLISLGPAKPISILVNLLFSPLFFFILFPLSWMAGVITPLQKLVDPVWSFFFQVLNCINLPIHFEIEAEPMTLFIRWIYVFSLQALCYGKERWL